MFYSTEDDFSELITSAIAFGDMRHTFSSTDFVGKLSLFHDETTCRMVPAGADKMLITYECTAPIEITLIISSSHGETSSRNPASFDGCAGRSRNSKNRRKCTSYYPGSARDQPTDFGLVQQNIIRWLFKAYVCAAAVTVH